MFNKDKILNFTYYKGRVALYAILKAMGIKKNDEVITQAFTCVAVPESILAVGAKPIYCDIEPDGFNLDPEILSTKITSNTKAIIVQHTFGIPANINDIKYIADKKGIPIIEDCCHTIMSKYRNKIVGNFGVASFYSYEWGKSIVVGIGGSASINDTFIKNKLIEDYQNLKYPPILKLLKIQLQYFLFNLLYKPPLYWKIKNLFNLFSYIGIAEGNYHKGDQIAEYFKYKMPKSLKNRLIKEIERLRKYSLYSKWLSKEYKNRINSIFLIHPKVSKYWDVYFVRYPLLTDTKETILKKAKNARIEVAGWYFTPVHPLNDKDLKKVNYEKGSCPNAEDRCKQILTLPTNIKVTKRDLNRIINFFNKL